jgi:hypothetical protein
MTFRRATRGTSFRKCWPEGKRSQLPLTEKADFDALIWPTSMAGIDPPIGLVKSPIEALQGAKPQRPSDPMG